ncbi:glycosyltransferase [Nonomuraea soli]|uniref:4,4'-diaponeurosporenoate glycosyltransferase n=1 Tax=Nonomuraea soli TaxID=1032476 RepID=A0A7W0HW68_9ACTN|nr:glycosyltransferase family 2 protein [Nonomuraea soli]MBA2897953.1 glycosyltransferase involved in cell wall biosynthesis [Nonomuraea soli]
MSIVIPAHNEAAVVGRLLSALQPSEFDIVVVANGCTDSTAAVAASHGARVIETPVPSKREALRLGDQAAVGFPRLYVDADVVIGADDVRKLCDALGAGGVLASAPERDLALADRPLGVRWYYSVWSRLPEVASQLFGRGVIAVSEEGNKRIMELPQVMADDLAASMAFSASERTVVRGARVEIQTPRTVEDLLRRRIRAVTSVAEYEQSSSSSARTGLGDLARIAVLRPLQVVWFMTVAVLARRAGRKMIAAGDYSTWLRDESSRNPQA